MPFKDAKITDVVGLEGPPQRFLQRFYNAQRAVKLGALRAVYQPVIGPNPGSVWGQMSGKMASI